MGGDERVGARVNLAREEGYQFRVRFGGDGGAVIHTDEPPPLGEGSGPNPSALLAAAIGNCLASSLLFCANKARVDVKDLTAQVDTTLVRNPEGRLRIGRMDVRITPILSADADGRLERCIDLFESFCIVTESVRKGIDVKVAVEPRATARIEDGSEPAGPSTLEPVAGS